MKKHLGKKRLSRKKRQLIEKSLQQSMENRRAQTGLMREADWRLDGNPKGTWILDRENVEERKLRYLSPAEIRWKPESGELSFFFHDGIETVFYQGIGIALLDGRGRQILQWFPLGELNDSRMDELDPGQN